MFRCKIFLSNVMNSSVFFIFAVVVVGVLAIVFKFSLLCSSHCVLILVVEVACNLSAQSPGFCSLLAIVTI